jgi:hypothetical protein
MDSRRARKIYSECASAIAYVDIERPCGERGIGSAFHVGGGVFVTARHVVEGDTILDVKITEAIGISSEEHFREHMNIDDDKVEKFVEQDEAMFRAAGVPPQKYKHFLGSLEILSGPFLASDPC